MRVFQQLRTSLSLCALILALPSAQVLAQTNASGAKPELPRAAEGNSMNLSLGARASRPPGFRIRETAGKMPALPAATPLFNLMALAAEGGDGQHDFDFEFGSWQAHIKRLLRPLTGSNDWVEYDGLSVVRKVWDGRANLGELDVHNPTARIQGMSLRLYNPQSRQWSIYWSNSRDGSLGTAMIGQFKHGRGEFYDQEMFQGAAIYVRFIFSDITPTSFRLEQAFSADGGKTWEPNWIATFTKLKQ